MVRNKEIERERGCNKYISESKKVNKGWRERENKKEN